MSARRGRSTVGSRARQHGSHHVRRAVRGRQFQRRAFIAASGVLVLAAGLGAAGITKPGYSIEMAVLRFLLFYAGVFALIGLTAAVGVGLLATDRIIMLPGGRIIAQGVHRAVSFGAVGFLVIHIAVEVVAGRSNADDAVVPFLDSGRTLYLGLGTVASDLFLLIVATGIMRGRFATAHPPWAWRALHAVAYLAWPLAIVHGLLAGRTAKPYVDWSYGACVAAVGLALVMRMVGSARVREMASSPVPGLGPWLPAGTGSPLDQAASLPVMFGGRERLAIAAPARDQTPAAGVRFGDEPAGGPPFHFQPAAAGQFPPAPYDGGDYGPHPHEHEFSGFAGYHGGQDVDGYGGGQYGGDGYGGGPPDDDADDRQPYDPDLYGAEPPTDPRMYAPGPDAWPAAGTSGRWAR